jgi:phosphatidylglycerophosphatase A
MYNKEILTKATFDALENRGVDFTELAKILYDIQHKYSPNLTVDDCLEHIMMVLKKREVQHAVLTGIAIDQLVEQKKFPQPIQEVIENDEGLYGIDEILALSITNIYGSIGLTNFGYLDKVKPGIIGEFDKKKEGQVHTFLDDILSAIVAAAASRLAHSKSE